MNSFSGLWRIELLWLYQANGNCPVEQLFIDDIPIENDNVP